MSKVYHFNEMESFFGSDEWQMEINVVDIWNIYQTNKDISGFNQSYALRLNEYKNEIVDLGADIWNEIVPIINEMNRTQSIEDSHDIYDKIYDWADKNDILIKTT